MIARAFAAVQTRAFAVAARAFAVAARAFAVAARVAIVSALVLAGACTPSTSTTQRMAIGSACATSGQCGTGAFYCDVSWPSGYCKVACTSDSSCPGGSICVGAGLIVSGVCLTPCQLKSDCRDGYECMSDTTSSHAYCAAPPATD